MSTKAGSNIKFANNLKKPEMFLGTQAKSNIWESNYLGKAITGTNICIPTYEQLAKSIHMDMC